MLITFEGIDGAGKSTQIKKLASSLTNQGVDVLSLREPGGTIIAERIRSILLESHHDITPVGELLLFSASRAELVENIIVPALADGKTVILDRFYDSTTAYQGYGRGIDLKLLQAIIAFSCHNVIPDITFFLDIEPEEALKRKNAKNSIPLVFEPDELDRMERSGIEFYRNVQKGYHAIMLQHRERFISINAQEPAMEIHHRILATLKERFSV